MRIASLLLLILVSPVASADDTTSLKWSLNENDTFYVTTRITQAHVVEVAAKKVDTTLLFNLTLRYRVKEVKAGETIIEVTYVAVDIEKDKQKDLESVGDKVRGSTVMIRLDDKHTLNAMRGHNEILKKFQGADDVERDIAIALFGAGGIRDIVARPFEILPLKDMRVAETVTRDDRGSIGGLSSTGKTNSKLERIADGIATVAVKSDMTIKVAEGPETPGVKMDLKSERAEGEYTFDTRAKRLKKFTHETVITGSITNKDTVVKIAINQKQTLMVSDKNPIRD